MTAMRSETWRTTESSWATNTSVRPKLVLQVLQQVNDLGLDRDVERGDRLVEHDERRLKGKGARDADALDQFVDLPGAVLVQRLPLAGHRLELRRRYRVDLGELGLDVGVVDVAEVLVVRRLDAVGVQ
jgi:hypothetical protein